MRILIRTLPLAGNYGGILQAYALQTVLLELGHDVVTDTSAPSGVRRRIRQLALASKRSLFPNPWFQREIELQVIAPLRDFVSQRIRTTNLYKGRRIPQPRAWIEYDAFIVGSDQIWRRRYADVESYLLDFAFVPDNRIRLAYAGSFGVNTLQDYDAAMIARTRRLARRFHAISVREDSGVALVRENWGLEAERLPDPTFLLEPSAYDELIWEPLAAIDFGRPYLAAYILDPEPHLQAIIGQIASLLGLPVVSLLPPLPSSIDEFRSHPEAFTRLAVGAWLSSLANASYVLTDSFHGVVFSILFQKQFLAISNTARGLTRFESLLGVLRLQNRLIPPTALLSSLSRLIDPVNWEEVNAIRRAERTRGLSFLAKYLR